VSWTDTSTLDSGFFIERRVLGTESWAEILSNVNITSYWDTDVGLGITYEYCRVKGSDLYKYLYEIIFLRIFGRLRLLYSPISGSKTRISGTVIA